MRTRHKEVKRGTNLKGSNLKYINLRGSNLKYTNLQGSNLRGVDLEDADLEGSNLQETNLEDADLEDANLKGADLRGSNLQGSNLRGSNLSGTNLKGADLRDTNLSNVKGLLNPSLWMKKNFQWENGYIVYKTFVGSYKPPERWKIAPGEIIEETPNPLPTLECACGVNFGTYKWIRDQYGSEVEIWECKILPMDLPSIVVPYNTDGKARCGRLQLLRRLGGESDENQK